MGHRKRRTPQESAEQKARTEKNKLNKKPKKRQFRTLEARLKKKAENKKKRKLSIKER